MARRLTLRGVNWLPVLLFVVAAGAVQLATRLAVHFLPVEPLAGVALTRHHWLDAWVRFDSGWYHDIAARGYEYHGRNVQSSVNFFPGYPAAMRVGSWLVGDVILAGVIVSYAAGLAAVVLFHRWCRRALGDRVARLAVAAVILYPFAYYLFGVVYSDALFLLAALAAFMLLEADRPVLAGVAGAVAGATRLVGLGVMAGLFIRMLELRGVFGWSRPSLSRGVRLDSPLLPRRLSVRGLRLRDAGVLLAPLGLVGFAALCWRRFGDPLAFAHVATSTGWLRRPTVPVFFKVTYFRLFSSYPLSMVHLGLTVMGVAAVLSLALVPAVVRRFGWGYTVYVLVAIGPAWASTEQFIGLGRYVLVLFPCFAAGADLLCRWSGRSPRLPLLVLATEALLLLLMASLFARWVYLT